MNIPPKQASQLRVLTWNIGGGKLLAPGADPSLLASYSVDGLEKIAQLIQESKADIVAIQEAQGNDSQNQIETIASLAGYPYCFYDTTSASHIDQGNQLGHGILSQHQIKQHSFGLFNNPNISIEWEDGTTAMSHDKGYSSCIVTVGNTAFHVTTLHLMPFRRFNIALNSKQAKEVLEGVSAKIFTSNSPALIMGDFNINDSLLAQYLPNLIHHNAFSEVATDTPTTPKDRHYDHVLFKDIQYVSKLIWHDVLTDHYPIICDFELPT